MVIDGCTPLVLGRALETGELPLMTELARRGSLHLDCVSVFPSITPAATASIITGRYPAEHGIGGMSWWNPETREVSYFGDDVRTILKRGIGDFLHAFLFRLNGEYLQAPTLFQIVERHGRRAACFNYLVFRGDVPHQATPPLLLRLLPSMRAPMTMYGPSWFCFGDLISTTGGALDLHASGGPFHRFGLDDTATAEFLRGVPDVAALPDLTVAYFADYDFESHDRGPAGAFDTLRRLDGDLRALFDQWGGLDRVLEHVCVVITADHAHSDISGDGDPGIALDDVLSGYHCADPESGWQDSDELVLCPNMRAAEVYVRDADAEITGRVCTALLKHPAVDHVIWRASDSADGEFHIASRDRGTLRFRRATGRTNVVRDEYGGRWALEGDLGVVDTSIEDGTLRYGSYPNALERVAAGMTHPRAGRLWVTARPGYEFREAGQQVHRGGGSHGTLHALDSLVPLLVAGHPTAPDLHAPPRIVDVAPLCASILGIPFP